MKKLTLILSVFSCFFSLRAFSTCPIWHAPICHAGSEINPNYIDLCVDFGSVWGHLAQHPLDTYGECQADQVIKPYACNAGLRHLLPPGEICVLYDQNRVAPTCEDSTNCVCSTTQPFNNLHQSDYMYFQLAPYSDNPAPNDFVTQRVIASPGPGFALAAPAQGEYIISNDFRFTFNLGSERIGADYFVDLCWKNEGQNLDQKTYRIDSSMTVTDGLLGPSGYLEKANVKSRFEIYCDVNDSGPTIYPSFPQYASALTPFFGGPKTYSQLVPGARSCFMRHYFQENERDYLRPHLLKKVTVLSSLDIEQDPPAPNGPVVICHVQQIQGNDYQCQTLSFPDADAYEQYVLTYNNIPDWRQDHQHDYQGQCQVEGPCERLIPNP